MAGKSRFKLTIYALLLATLLLGLVKILSGMDGLLLYLELAGFLFLVILMALGFVGYAKEWGEDFFFFTFLFYLVNLILLWYFSGLFYLVLLILTLSGFILSIPKKENLHELEEEVVSQSPPPEPEKKAATFSPGKYVASSRSNTFHEPKCDWAKKIKAEKIWFTDKQEAEDKSYKAHGCVK